ncbi:MAG: hypothetical protein QXY20_09540 [Thermofilum sp.]|uniref:hypothetical protein n=1 Tax=Thermofilum sp. TaxID=1961369 RepID=UPI00315E0596
MISDMENDLRYLDEEIKKLKKERMREEREMREKEMRNTLIKIYTKVVLQNNLIKTQIQQILSGQEYTLAEDELEKLEKITNELYNNIILNKTKKYKIDNVEMTGDLLKHYSAVNTLVRLICYKKTDLEICHQVGENTLLTILFDLNNEIRYLLKLLAELS